MGRAHATAAAAVLAIAALPGGTAFMQPVSSHGLRLNLASGAFCKGVSQPVSAMRRRSVRSNALASLSMELVGKRYWLWNTSEWLYDRLVALTQVVVFTLYGVLSRLFESPYDEARLKAIRRRIAELRASREAAEPRNALDMMDVVWEVSAADEKVSEPASTDAADKGTSLASSSVPAGGDDLSAVDAGEVNGREAAFFTIVAVPVVLQVLGMMEHDNPAVPYFIAAANASVWFAALCIFVDWAAGSPSGIATQVKRWLPVSLRRALSPINPKSIFFTEEADQGRRGYYEGLLPRPPNTDNNGLW